MFDKLRKSIKRGRDTKIKVNLGDREVETEPWDVEDYATE